MSEPISLAQIDNMVVNAAHIDLKAELKTKLMPVESHIRKHCLEFLPEFEQFYSALYDASKPKWVDTFRAELLKEVTSTLSNIQVQ